MWQAHVLCARGVRTAFDGDRPQNRRWRPFWSSALVLAEHNEDGTPKDGVCVDVDARRHRLCAHVAGFRTKRVSKFCRPVFLACVSDATKCACRIVPVTPFCAPFTWEPCTRPRHCVWCVGWWHRYAPSCSHTSCVCRLAWQLLLCVATSVGPACGLCAHGTWFRRPIW